MVAKIALRSCERYLAYFSGIKIKFSTAVDVHNCLTQIKLPVSVHSCAACTELPYNISFMIFHNNRVEHQKKEKKSRTMNM